MPALDGVEATRRLAGPDVADPMAVVVITTFDLDEYVHAALKAGARGFLLKDAGPELLGQAVEGGRRGRRPHRAQRHRPPARDVRRRPARPHRPRRPASRSPTARSRCSRASRAAAPTAEIAAELHISLSTVKTHIAKLMGKLGARNRVEIAIWAHESGRAGPEGT